MKKNCQLQEKRNSVNINETQYDPMNEEDRRLNYSKANKKYGLALSLAFTVLIVVFGLIVQYRGCPDGYGLDGAIC